jgi:hypothetical protein
MVTVEEAIKKGHMMVTFPGLLIMFALTVCCFYLDITNKISDITLSWGLVLSLFICWLYYSFMVTRWKLWAFSNVADLVELEFRAIKEMLL